MKKQTFLLAIFLLIGLAAFSPISAGNHTVPKKEGVKSLVDWPAFLGCNDLIGELLRKKFDHGIFMAMVLWGVS